MRTIFFELGQGLRIALRAVGTHRLRALLTTLGVVIGILSVTAMAAVINGVERDFDEEMAALGTDVLYVQKWPWAPGPGFQWWDYINRPEITAELAEVVQERARLAVAAVPVVDTDRTVRHGSRTLTGITIQGSTPDYPRVHVVRLARGRFFTDLEDRGRRAVCVLGAEVAARLFPVEEPLGKAVRIAGHRFQVIGVLERTGSSAEGPASEDEQVKVPYHTFARFFGVAERGVSVEVRIAAPEQAAAAKDELTGLLRAARGLDALDPNDFEINDQQALREQLAPVKWAIYAIGLFLTALALVVGGIGVMNIMFVSVKERTREIGIRKAVGARRRAILTQFLLEAVLVCLLGGLLGLLLTLPVVGLVQRFLPAYLDAGVVALAFGLCVVVGVLFGLVPAWSAAKAEPIQALRYE